MIRARVLLLVMQNATWRETIALQSLIRLFEFDPRVEVVVADARAPLIPGVRTASYDLIVLSPSFLCSRYSTSLLGRVQERFDFVSESTALKVAMVQDDYDCAWILDKWLHDWAIDIIYSICPSNWSLLYPLCSRRADIRLGFTRYILDSDVSCLSELPTWENRNLDVVYRGSQLPLNFGELGQQKAHIAEMFRTQIPAGSDLNLDLAVGATSIITGPRWLQFLQSSKFTLVAPSGSSFVDPYGDLRQLADDTSTRLLDLPTFRQEAQRRQLRYFEVENTMLSPRNIEAALCGTVQIAVTSSYSQILIENVHFVPLSDVPNNPYALADEVNWERIRTHALDAVLSERRLRAVNFVSDLLENIYIPPTSLSPGMKPLSTNVRWIRLLRHLSKLNITLFRYLSASVIALLRAAHLR